VSNSTTHWALLGCASSYVALCIELHYTINFVALCCDLCCIMLHFVLYCTTLHSNSTTLHYVRFLLRCELCYIALCCIISSTALWTLLCCFVTNFVMLCVAFCCELYYASSSINLSSNNMHTQKKQLTGSNYTHRNKNE
jgi:hypothetical protein